MSRMTMPPEVAGGVLAAAPGAVARRRGWWARNWTWAVPGGVVLLGALAVGVVVLLFALVFGVIRGTEVYETAYTEARSNLAVVAAIGTPIEDGWMCAGNIEVTPGSGHADLGIPIEGSAGRATIHVVAAKSGRAWTYETLEVTVHETGETIDLLADR